MTVDGLPGVGTALDEALVETHHPANLSNLAEARLARRRLVEAQGASSVERTRDRLEQAIEYLELARLERRDTAAGSSRRADSSPMRRPGFAASGPYRSPGHPSNSPSRSPNRRVDRRSRSPGPGPR